MPGPAVLPLARRAVRRRPAARRLAAVVSVALAASAGGETLRVGAAASLREVVAATARDFEAAHAGVEVEVSYGASSVLAAQLRAGAPLDVLLSADAELADALTRERVVGPARSFARNRLVVLARAELPAFERPEDLAGVGLRRVAVPHPAVPVGRYARRWLSSRGLLDALETRLVATEHARATLLAVDAGHVDAAIVYTTDAALARRARVAWVIPDEEQPTIRYAVAVSRRAREPALAGDFVASLFEGRGRAHLEAAGFAPEPLE